MYMATYVDYGETCDGHAKKLGVYKDSDSAVRDIYADMESYIRHFDTDDAVVRRENFEVWKKNEEGVTGCVWDIIEFDPSDLCD